VEKSSILRSTEIGAIFVYFLPKFGYHGNSLSSLKISDIIFNFAGPENLTICVKKFSIFYAELNSVEFLLIFAQIWFTKATPLASLKFQIAYLISPTPKTLLFVWVIDFLRRTKLVAIFAYFWPNVVAMATPLPPLKFQITYLNSSDPVNLTICVEKSSIFCTELKSMQFLFIFALPWLP